MANRPAIFLQSDVTRALKAAAAASIPVASYEIKPDGVIRVFVEGSASAPQSGASNSWDDVLDGQTQTSVSGGHALP